MKKRNALVLIPLALLTTHVSAKGLLGEKYFGASYDIGTIEDIDLWAVSFEYNRPLGADNKYAYDLNLSASYAELEEFGVTVDGQDIDLGLVIYPTEDFELKPFLGLSAGFGKAALLGESDDSFKYQVTIGGEWKHSEAFTITPYWSYFDYTSLEGGGKSVVGIEGSLWVKEQHNIGIDYSRLSIDGYHLDVLSFIYRRSF